jgi:hypothetical protein
VVGGRRLGVRHRRLEAVDTDRAGSLISHVTVAASFVERTARIAG